jgi:hypothetical protein
MFYHELTVLVQSSKRDWDTAITILKIFLDPNIEVISYFSIMSGFKTLNFARRSFLLLYLIKFLQELYLLFWFYNYMRSF